MSPSQGSGLLEEVLAGGRGAQGVREVVTRPLRHRADEVVDPAGLTATPTRLRLLRSKYKPSRKLTAYYLATPELPGDPQQVATAWTLEPNGVRLTIQVAPADPAMPQLPRLSSVDHVAGLVETLTGRPARLRGAAGTRTIRYRPGQRHVLAVPFVDRDVYVKTDRDRRGALAVERAALLGDALARTYPQARTAEPIGWAAEDAAALWWGAPGMSLSQLLSGRDPGRVTTVERVGRALRAVHDAAYVGSPPSTSPGEPPVPQSEAAAVLSAGAHVATLLPDVGALYAAMVAEVVERLGRLAVDRPVMVHGDFKGDNILVHRGHPRILDLDRTRAAEPALDLGKFLADLAWWSPEATGSPVLEAAFRAGYGPGDPARWARAELWAVLFALKLAARRCAVHEPDWDLQVRRRVLAAGGRLRRSRTV